MFSKKLVFMIFIDIKKVFLNSVASHDSKPQQTSTPQIGAKARVPITTCDATENSRIDMELDKEECKSCTIPQPKLYTPPKRPFAPVRLVKIKFLQFSQSFSKTLQNS